MAADDTIAPDEVAALLAVPPEEFVAARTARAKELKADGRKEEGAALAKLRKPVRLVWIVGELARRHGDVAASAAEVAEELEEAQASGSGVRPLLKRFRDVVGQVAELADQIEGNVDRLEVGLALREVLADPDARRAWIEGRLLALPGDEEDDAPPDELAPRREKKAAAKKAAAKKKAAGEKAAPAGEDEDDADADAEAERAREEAERAAQEEARRVAQAAADETEAEVAEATSAHERAVTTVAELEEQLAALEARVAEARSTVEDAEAAVATAEERHTTATAALDELGGPLPKKRPRPRPGRRR